MMIKKFVTVEDLFNEGFIRDKTKIPVVTIDDLNKNGFLNLKKKKIIMLVPRKSKK